MNIPLVLIFFIITLISCQRNDKQTHTAPNNTANKETNFSYKTFVTNNKWGYDIYLNNSLVIHQPSMPAIHGNEGFSTARHAKLVAELAIKKLKNGTFPPSISIEELDSLKVR